MVVTQQTIGGAAEAKRWAILFTCMSTRAIHIKVVECMDTSSCINALRRFFSVHGPVKQLFLDHGTNLITAYQEMGMGNVSKKDPVVQRYLNGQGCEWKFNPPHSSHWGGPWEHIIGVKHRILDSMLLQYNSTHLTHEVLSTVLAEVFAILNTRPLIPVSVNPNSPLLLTLATLLTQTFGDYLLMLQFRRKWIKNIQTFKREI